MPSQGGKPKGKGKEAPKQRKGKEKAEAKGKGSLQRLEKKREGRTKLLALPWPPLLGPCQRIQKGPFGGRHEARSHARKRLEALPFERMPKSPLLRRGRREGRKQRGIKESPEGSRKAPSGLSYYKGLLKAQNSKGKGKRKMEKERKEWAREEAERKAKGKEEAKQRKQARSFKASLLGNERGQGPLASILGLASMAFFWLAFMLCMGIAEKGLLGGLEWLGGLFLRAFYFILGA